MSSQKNSPCSTKNEDIKNMDAEIGLIQLDQRDTDDHNSFVLANKINIILGSQKATLTFSKVSQKTSVVI